MSTTIQSGGGRGGGGGAGDDAATRARKEKLAIRLFRRASRISDGMSLRDAQNILERLCGFRTTGLEILGGCLGYSWTERFVAVSESDFVTIFLYLVQQWDQQRLVDAVESLARQLDAEDGDFIAKFRQGATVEVFTDGAWIQCTVTAPFDNKTGTTSVTCLLYTSPSPRDRG